MQLEDVLGLNAVGGLGAPEQLQVGRQHLLGQRTIDNLVDGGSIADACITADAQALTCGLQHGEQRVQLLGLSQLVVGRSLDVLLLVALELKLGLGVLGGLHLLVGLGLGQFCLFTDGGAVLDRRGILVAVGQTLVELLQIGQHLVGVVGLPEFEVGRTLQQLTHALGLADSRHLNANTALGALHLLDVGLHHAELVDTCADHIE